MGLFRLLFLLAIIATAIWLWRRFTQSTAARSSSHSPTPKSAPMVRCQHCGTHVPRDHALSHDGQWFCSQTHLEQGPRNNGQ